MRGLLALLTVALGLVTTFVSDLFIRTQSIPGTDPHAYDVVGSLMIGAGGVALLRILWQDVRR